MKQRDDEERSLWQDLVLAALQEAPQAVDPPAASVGPGMTATTPKDAAEVPPAARAMGVIQEWGRVIGGGAPSLLTQAMPSGGASWLKWLNPIAGLVSLFTGREEEDQPELSPILSPRLPKRRLDYGLMASEGGSLRPTDLDERGRIRLAEANVTSPQQVVVQVQTMDSRSFLDNRDEIASAVRQALMESHGLGAVLREFQE